ncbi:MAG: polyphosphate polymerase domain-containing protein [Bacteroidales bacterium]|nr:polyphosphate polymerase domain-containing protein [Bacteroidales bacterium]
MPQQENNAILHALEPIPPIALGEMDGVRLMNRIDSKYITTEETLTDILNDARAAGYRALEVDGVKMSAYNSVYFDTAELRMFQDHRNRHLTRQKIRTRVYVNSGDTFLEIKRKHNTGRTKKKRTPIPAEELTGFASDPAATAYLEKHSCFTAGMLSPVLSTRFSRITLVNPAMTERVTIDTALFFSNFRTGKKASLEDAVIIELKQDGHCRSQMKGILLKNRVKPMRVSKYCIAETLTDPAARSGRFKLKVRRIEKLINKKITII